MVQINFALREVNCKIVYYGPGMSGKTTNLEVVHQKAPEQHKGDLTSISTDGDRTLFFDFMPLDLGMIAGMRTKFQLYTVPGQVYYNSTRKLVLQGVDGVIFVADSDPTKLAENLESFKNLEENLREYGKDLKDLPHVVQFNKRDLPQVMSMEQMNAELNPYNVPTFEAVATTGQGVFPTLKVLAGMVLESINKAERKSVRSGGGARTSAPGVAAPTPQAAGPSRTAQPAKSAPRHSSQAPAGSGAWPGSTPSRAPAPAASATKASPKPAAQQSGARPSANLNQLMRSKSTKGRVQADRRGETKPAARRSTKPTSQKSKGGNMLYGLVFALLVAAVAAVVAMYLLQ